MTSKVRKRMEIIQCIVKNYGIECGDKVFMGLWDLFGNINNTWNAKHFVNSKKYPTVSSPGYVLADYNFYLMGRAVRDTLKKTGCFELRQSHDNKSEYLVGKL